MMIIRKGSARWRRLLCRGTSVVGVSVISCAFFLVELEDTMRIILNMSHARCLFAQHVCAAQLTPCVLQKALPFSPTTINRIFKAVANLRSEKPGGTKGSADLMASSCTEHKEIKPKRLDFALWE